jgi:hypothetical protein
MDKCPKCGGLSGFTRSTKCNGWWKEQCTWDGTVQETDLDSVKYMPKPKTVICADCFRRIVCDAEGGEGER